MYPFSDLCNRYLCIYILFTKTGCRICGIILAPCLSVIYLCISKHTNTGIAPTRLTCNSFVLLAIRCLTPTCPTQRMRTSATTGRWSLASIPSSESAVSTNTPFASLHHHEILVQDSEKKMGKDTHHPTPSLRPNTKSMHTSSSLRLWNPVNVAHCPPTDARGAAYRISRITSPFSFSSGEEPAGLESRGKRRENSSGTAGAAKVPVRTA